MADSINKIPSTGANKPEMKAGKKSNRFLGWLKRPKSASPSASQQDSTKASVPSASRRHDPGPGNAGEISEQRAPGGNGTSHQDSTAAFQLVRSPFSSNPGLSTSAVDKGYGSKTSRNLTLKAPPASMNPRTQVADQTATVKEGLGVASRFAQTLLKKVPDCLDGNPIKMAFSIAKVIIDIKDAVEDNNDELAQRLGETANRLLAVETAVVGGIPQAAKQSMEKFKQILGEEMKRLEDLSSKCLSTQILDHEDYKKRIQDIFQRVEGATTSFQLKMTISIQNTTTSIEQTADLERLRPSHKADHKTILGDQILKREQCTPGTRVKILEDITKWANDSSSESAHVFWLTGPAGSGKTTIAYTIAKLFEKGGNAAQQTILGANFLCSRQFEETRQENRIIPTIAYQLARKCRPYSDALHATNKFDAVNYDVAIQLEALLVGPWQQSEATREQGLSSYLIVVDALDEIEGDRGSAFLNDLLTAINDYNLKGFKFLVTSRSEPEIIALCESFASEAIFWLQHVPIEEAELDVGTYLKTKLPKLAGSPELTELVRRTGGLFIYAATAVKHLTRSRSVTSGEQAKMLSELLSNTHETAPASKATFLIDELYKQIMHDAFSQYEGEVLIRRLQILHTFLCTAERTSTSIVAALVAEGNDYDISAIARAVAEDLHAVLYSKDDRVFWYHTSFPDFIFNPARSNFHLGGDNFSFSCTESAHHNLLAESCFRVMRGLRFNMGDIKSSFLFDDDNSDTLSENVKINISDVLKYSCRHWAHHLPSSEWIDAENLGHCISDFLQIQILFWIEAMNLLRLSNQCTPMLQRARQWLLKRGDSYLNLACDVGEAANFATYFTGSPAAKSTPHLYISALATWAHDTSLCRNWKKQFARIPVFTHSNGSIDLPLMTIPTGNSIWAVAFSSDGTRIVSGSGDRSVRVWDASTGAQLKVLKGHTWGISSVAFSRDGTRIVSGSGDHSVWVWDVSTGAKLKVLKGHTNWVTSVAFSSDGTRIVSGSGDHSVRVWDVSTGAELKAIKGHTSRVNSVAISSDGTRIVSVSDDHSVQVWDTSTGAELKVLNGHNRIINSVAFSSDGTQIVSGSSADSVRVWDTSTGAELKVLNGHTRRVNSVAFSNDGTRIVSGSDDRSVRVWDASTGAELKVLNGHINIVNSVVFSSDSTRIISGSRDHSVRVWDPSTGAEQKALTGHTGSVRSVVFSSDGTRIVSGSDDHSVRVWDASTGAELKALNGHTSNVNSVAISSDSTRVISGSHDHSVRVWDASTGAQLKVLNGHILRVNSVAFSRDDTRIVSGSDDRSVRVWDASTGAELKVLNGHTDWVTSVTFSNNDTRIVSGSSGDSVRVWDASTGAHVKVLKRHISSINYSEAFSSDGTRIVSGRGSASIRVWDASTGAQLKVLKGHTKWVNSVAFSSDGTRIVSGSDDHSVRVWDASTGAGLKVLNGHTDLVNSVTLSPYSQLIWYLTDTNWIISSLKQHRLMWVPQEACVPPQYNILVISRHGFGSVDFRQSKIGVDWVGCYTP